MAITRNTAEPKVSNYVDVDLPDAGPMTAVAREPHDSLFCAIERISQYVERLDWLRGKILGEEITHDPTPERPTPSLDYVLTNGPDLIDAQLEKASQIIEEINGLLFYERPPKR